MLKVQLSPTTAVPVVKVTLTLGICGIAMPAAVTAGVDQLMLSTEKDTCATPSAPAVVILAHACEGGPLVTVIVGVVPVPPLVTVPVV